jgi:manganese/zinc/iron transport system permease protein
VIAFRAVGLILVLALLFAPFLFLKARGLKSALLLSVLIGVAASFGGVALSRHLLTVYGWALSTGGLVVLTLGMGLFFRRALW